MTGDSVVSVVITGIIASIIGGVIGALGHPVAGFFTAVVITGLMASALAISDKNSKHQMIMTDGSCKCSSDCSCRR